MSLFTHSPTRSLMLVLGLVAGCLPPTGGADQQPDQETSVRVPAAVGTTVELSARDLMAVDASWRDAGLKQSLAVSVQYGGQPVACEVSGGADGILNPEDRITFSVAHTNRHSPWLTYRVVRPSQGTGELCTLADDSPRATSVLDAAFGRTTGTVSSAGLAERALESGLRRDTDYLVIAPAALVPAISGLLDHRRRLGHAVAVLTAEDVFEHLSEGNPTPDAIRRAVKLVHQRTGGQLRYLLLVGDADVSYRPDVSAPTPVPTFYHRKVHYPGYESEQEYPSDHLYGVVDTRRRLPSEATPPPRVAVGRLPARNADEARALANKVVGYETEANTGDWQRRLVLFGGPANYGKFVDSVIETVATSLLNNQVPYDYDLSVMFAKADSPYAWPFDRLDERLVADLNAGSLFAAYFGHGLQSAFDNVAYRNRYYTFGKARSLEGVSIPRGKPVFLSFTCHTGAFDRKDGELSLGEVLANDDDGPVAVFASSRSSHPYPNALYAQSFIDVFLNGQPATLGEGVLAMKAQLLDRRLILAEALVGQDVSELKQEHLGLYNLLGDPATRLRYPRRVTVATDVSARGGDPIPVTIQLDGASTAAIAMVTLETRRIEIRGDIIGPDELEAMPVDKAFEAMASNLPVALDKVIVTKAVGLVNGKGTLSFAAPDAPGEYVIKAFVSGDARAGAGHTSIQVLGARTANALSPP